VYVFSLDVSNAFDKPKYISDGKTAEKADILSVTDIKIANEHANRIGKASINNHMYISRLRELIPSSTISSKNGIANEIYRIE